MDNKKDKRTHLIGTAILVIPAVIMAVYAFARSTVGRISLRNPPNGISQNHPPADNAMLIRPTKSIHYKSQHQFTCSARQSLRSFQSIVFCSGVFSS